MVTTATHTNARKSVTVPFPSATPKASEDTLVTLTVTAQELVEIKAALAAHELSWEVRKNTEANRKALGKSLKDRVVDGNFIFWGGKANAHYKQVGKIRTMNKYALIVTLNKRLGELVSKL